MSLFANPLNKYKKRFLQAENPNQDENESFSGKKKQISLHGSPITSILRNTQAKFGTELELSPNPYEIFVGDYNLIEIQRLKEIWKEIEKTRKRHNWKQIRILTLRLGGRCRGPLQDFDYMASLFAKSFSDLTTLSVKGLDEKNDAKLGLCLISKIGRNLLKLKDLTLEFFPYSNVNECIKVLIMETLGNLVSLRYLDLSFSGSNTITSDEIDLLCEGINKKAPKLVSLTLDFGSCRNFNDECMEILGSKLCYKLSELSYLELRLSINNFTNHGVMQLSNFLTFDLQKLQNLNIDLFHCELVTPEGFVYLAEKIAQHLKNLEELSYAFGIQLQPGTEDEEDSEDDDEDNEDDGVEKKSLYDLRIERETAYRNGIEEKLNKILSYIPLNRLYLDSEVVLG